MRSPGGLLTILDPAGETPAQAIDTVSCGHCQRIVLTKAGTASTVYLLPLQPVTLQTLSKYQEEPGATCLICMRPICLRCYKVSQTALQPCVVWERRLQASEDRERFRRQLVG